MQRQNTRLRATVQKAPFFYPPQAKEHTMKIIVTGNPTIGPLHGQYEAKKWEVDQDGYLEILDENNQIIGTHAPGTWAHVRGYAEEQ